MQSLIKKEGDRGNIKRTAKIPLMTIGIIHLSMRSGLNTPRATTPTPDFEVPYDAPIPKFTKRCEKNHRQFWSNSMRLFLVRRGDGVV